MQKENSYVAVTYTPGAFLHANMDEEVHMLLEGTIAELIIKLKQKLYRRCIWKNKNYKPFCPTHDMLGDFFTKPL